MRQSSDAGACAMSARATLRLNDSLRRLPTTTATRDLPDMRASPVSVRGQGRTGAFAEGSARGSQAATQVGSRPPRRPRGAQAWAVSAPGGEGAAVFLRPEADEDAIADLQHRPLDHRRLLQHQGDGLALVEPGLLRVRQLAEGGAGPVENGLPADLGGPALQMA